MTKQEKREKVIKGLECCATNRLRREDCEAMACSYLEYEGNGCIHRLVRDALALLKAQEPVKPKWEKGYAYCGKCGYKLHWIVDQNNFCPNCGQAVRWT